MLAARQPRPSELTTTAGLQLFELLMGQTRGKPSRAERGRDLAQPDRPHSRRPARADPLLAPAKAEPGELTWLPKHPRRWRCDGGGGGTGPGLREDEPDKGSCTRDIDGHETSREQGACYASNRGGEMGKPSLSTA
jgi:hypothetical protein